MNVHHEYTVSSPTDIGVLHRTFYRNTKYNMGLIIRQGFSFKLKPDGAQDRKMSRFAGCTRWVYNHGIAWNEERRTADPAFRLSYAKLCSKLLVWKEQNPWLKETHSQVLQQSLKGSDGLFPEVLQRSVGLPEEAQEVRDNGLLPLPAGLQD